MIAENSLFTNAETSRARTCAVCISQHKEDWKIPNLSFLNYTGGWKPFRHERTRERVAYLAERRNLAVSQALSAFPHTDHILMIDSYYLHQGDQIRGLIREYANMIQTDYPKGCILGASTWILDKTRVRSRLRFYDSWTTPEGSNLKLHEAEKTGGIIKVRAVGGCYLYPRSVWEKTRYDVPEDLHGCEHNWLCEHSGLPVYLSLNQMLWHEPVAYSMLKRLRVSLHLRRLFHKAQLME